MDFTQGVAYVLDNNGIISVDLSSGHRALLSAPSTDQGPWGNTRRLMLRANGTLLMLSSDSLIEVDRISGYRTAIFDEPWPSSLQGSG
ncbi:MAG: hypothetical protein V7629_09370 [Motiliproteus sp.]